MPSTIHAAWVSDGSHREETPQSFLETDSSRLLLPYPYSTGDPLAPRGSTFQSPGTWSGSLAFLVVAFHSFAGSTNSTVGFTGWVLVEG